MKTLFENLKKQSAELSILEIDEKVSLLVDEIKQTDNRLLSVDKAYAGTGTWESSCFANEYHFGDELAAIITKAVNGSTTHDEDKVFLIDDFTERIHDEILEYIHQNQE